MTKSKSLYQRPGDIIIVLFLTLHIPITLLFATQVVLGPNSPWVPSWATETLKLAVSTSKDPLLSMGLDAKLREPWAISLFAAELVFQLPLFLYLGAGYCSGTISI